MTLPKTYDALISEANTLDLYSKLIQQINKDFHLANIDLDFEKDLSPKQLKQQLHEIVFQLINEKFAEYLNLLYIIDVSEQKIKGLDGHDTLKLSEEVTFLILQREWQKVWLKNQYS
ncbi:hypothetical protein AB9K26_12915 [Psychroserpens sp. XS_ASV72]|uniref:hypothetical protein n=1 Tax=Psychroserpens sp. XS_ASV72 TaxID=3241293 RepID=UPI003516F883